MEEVKGSKSKHREMETYETNPDFARVSFLRNTRSAALGVSGFEKRNIRVPRAVSPVIRLDISFPSSGMWGVTGETGTRTNTNPNDTEANAAGRSVRACVARKSKS